MFLCDGQFSNKKLLFCGKKKVFESWWLCHFLQHNLLVGSFVRRLVGIYLLNGNVNSKHWHDLLFRFMRNFICIYEFEFICMLNIMAVISFGSGTCPEVHSKCLFDWYLWWRYILSIAENRNISIKVAKYCYHINFKLLIQVSQKYWIKQ